MSIDVRRVARASMVAVATLILITPMTVAAHAELDTATPADGSTVQGSPPDVSGTFTQDMKPDGSSLQLRDESGDVIAEGGVDPDDPRRMAIADMPVLAPGTYEVRWTTISAEDDELARDRWTFTVVEASPSPPPAPTDTPAPSPTPAPTATTVPTSIASVAPSAAASAVPPTAASPTPSGDTGEPAGSTSDVLLPIIIGLAIVAVVAVVLVRRRGQTSPPA